MERLCSERNVCGLGTEKKDIVREVWIMYANILTRLAGLVSPVPCCRDGRVLLWRWHDCAVPMFGTRVIDAAHSVPVPLSAAGFLGTHTAKGGGLAVPRMGVDCGYHVATSAGNILQCTLNAHSAELSDWQAKTAAGSALRLGLSSPCG
jgi:hypothetical protein